ncbi:MAG TPA: HEAT repeat domain-containing protein [Pyrinomonadaceae bacterium]|nr:HEAT repeat domain-containing protein [Pyrinomonadaceae bacterium]
MNKPSLRQDIVAQKNARGRGSLAARLGLAAAMCCALAASMSDAPNAQKRNREQPVRVTGVATSGNTVSISADGSLNRAQTWQDPEGFHVVVPDGQASDAAASRGVKVRHVGNSLELVVPVRQGASVTVEPKGNQLNLVVNGGSAPALSVENFPVEAKHGSRTRVQTDEPGAQESKGAEGHAQQSPNKRRAASDEAAVEPQQTSSQPASQQSQKSASQSSKPVPQVQQGEATSPAASNPDALSSPAAPPQAENSAAAQLKSSLLPSQQSRATQPQTPQTSSGGGFSSFVFSLPGLLILLGVALAGAALVIIRRARRRSEEVFDDAEYENKSSRPVASAAESRRAAEPAGQPFQSYMGDRRKANIAVPFERRKGGRGAEDEASRQQLASEAEGAGRSGRQDHVPDVVVAKPSAQAVQFGAYRVEQEISRLVQGKTHSVEVLSSRALDDRRAVEASLLKALRAPETDEDGRRRARMALEDYGFVARECASLLLGAEGFERAYAARTLGEMRSAHALPFLKEALYDADSVVRLECVQSLGSLGLPSAIGALLDVASRHKDIPAALIGPALTACSVESVEPGRDSYLGGRTNADAGEDTWFSGEVRLLAPVENFDELPEWIEDENLRVALVQLESMDVESRVNAAHHLAQFRVRRSVAALASMSQEDPEPGARAAAVTSLGVVDHELVFAPVIIALADEAREVRAAAARALSRLSFDRADAYVRVFESADSKTLRGVARACSKAGLASQAISRLASEDRRQAYEAFSLLSLCVKAGEVQPILDAVECHRDIEVRFACINLLATSLKPETCEQLTRVAENGGVPEKVRRTILETVGRAPKPEPVSAD